MYAPIVVFAFNRLDSLRGTIESLLANTEARESHLFVFVDGPRKEKESEQEKVAKVQEYVKSIRQLTTHSTKRTRVWVRLS